jgi:alpha-1,2-mannosyltransferase
LIDLRANHVFAKTTPVNDRGSCRELARETFARGNSPLGCMEVTSSYIADAPVATRSRAKHPRWWLPLEIWAGVIVVAALAQVFFKLGTYQWDLIVYWWGGHAFATGHSPYGAIPNQPVYLHYVYPPITAALFAPLSLLNVAAAKLVWITAKAAALWATVRMWQKATSSRDATIPPIFFFTFAFGSALLVDVTAGNIAVFEQFVLWLGFTALLARKPWIFALLVVVIAQFKLTPIFFLGVLLVIDERPRWAPFVGGLTVFGALLASNFVAYPAQMHEFFTSISSLNERGWGDPATLGVMQDLVDQVQSLGINIPSATAYVLYGAAALSVLYYTFRWWMRRRAESNVDRVLVVLISLVVYALVMPRMKDYSYVALLPAAWYVLAKCRLNNAPIVVLATLVPRPLPQLNLRLPLLTQAYVYAPLFGALAVWCELISESNQREIATE